MKRLLFLLMMVLLLSNNAQGAPLIVDFEAVPEQYYLDADWTQATGNLDGFYDGLWFGRYAGIYVTGMINYNDDVYPPHSGEKVLASGQSSGLSTTIGVEFRGGATNYVGVWYSWAKSGFPEGPQTLLFEVRDSTYTNVLYSEAVNVQVTYGNALWEVTRADPDISFLTVTGPTYKFILDDLTFEAVAGAQYPGSYPSAVPIPHSAWLLGIGLIGLVAFRRQSKN